jgi:hypothetical protein
VKDIKKIILILGRHFHNNHNSLHSISINIYPIIDQMLKEDSKHHNQIYFRCHHLSHLLNYNHNNLPYNLCILFHQFPCYNNNNNSCNNFNKYDNNINNWNMLFFKSVKNKNNSNYKKNKLKKLKKKKSHLLLFKKEK